jgi:hypothetical protein
LLSVFPRRFLLGNCTALFKIWLSASQPHRFWAIAFKFLLRYKVAIFLCS